MITPQKSAKAGLLTLETDPRTGFLPCAKADQKDQDLFES
jgi:hypothetical protein